MIWDFILNRIPWWVQVCLLLIPVSLAFWFAVLIFGWERVRRWLVPVLGVLAAIGLLSRARQQGYADRGKKEQRDADSTLDRARQARERIRQQQEEQLREIPPPPDIPKPDDDPPKRRGGLHSKPDKYRRPG